MSGHFDRPRTTWTDARINPQPTDWRTHTQISRPIGGQTHRSTDRSADRQPINRPIGGQGDQPTDRSADNPTYLPTDGPDQPADGRTQADLTNLSIYLWTNERAMSREIDKRSSD